MQTTPDISAFPARQADGLTLLELLVAMALLSVIILGLYAMFDRTQRAFIASVAQVDVHEGSRAAVSLIGRDLLLMQPSGDAAGTNYNFYVNDVAHDYSLTPMHSTNLDGTILTNRLDELFFLTHASNWMGVGYIFAPISTNRADMLLFTNGVGALLRYEISTNLGFLQSNNLYTNYFYTTTNEIGFVLGGGVAGNYSNLQRVAEGVVNFAVTPYYRDTNVIYFTNLNFAYFSYSNNLPAYVELELGVLEPQMVEQARAIANLATQRKFLTDTNRIGRYHLFRQQVTVPAAN